MEKKKIIKKLFKRLSYFRTSIILLCSMFLIRSVIAFIYPILIKIITDRGMLYKNMMIVTTYAIAMMIFLVVEQVIGIWQIKISLKVKNNFQKLLYENAFKKLLSLKVSYFNEKNGTEIIDQLSTDINCVSIIADDGLIGIANYVLKMVSGAIGLFIIDKKLACVVLLFIPVKWYLVTKTSKKKEIHMKQYIGDTKKFAEWFGDIIGGIKEIKLWNMYKAQKSNFDELQEQMIKSNFKFSIMDCYNSSGDAIINAILNSGLYFVGGWLVCQSQLSIGSLVAFISYSSYVTGPIATLFNLKYLFAGILPSAYRLYEFMESEEEPEGGKIVLKEFENIEFNNVSYSYGNNKVLENANIKISRGNKIAIIGENGSGKTTLINLLLRFISPISGEIIFDGTSIQDMDLKAYRNLFAVVSQDVYLFRDTILNNINMNGECSAERLEEICQKLNLCDFISELDGNMIEKNGSNISGGERRKVAIARAIVKNSPIVILDEASSNLDMDSNRKLHDLIVNDFYDKTVILITHDYNYLDGMDRVYKLEKGMLV